MSNSLVITTTMSVPSRFNIPSFPVNPDRVRLRTNDSGVCTAAAWSIARHGIL